MGVYLSQDDRDGFVAEVEQLGKAANALRERLLDARLPFAAGIVRAAEETLLLAYSMLKDSEARDL